MSAPSLQPGRAGEAGPPAEEAGGLLTIDLDALAANWRFLRDRAGPAECCAVVKADAYGIGLEPAVRALARTGCRTFFVAHLSEEKGVGMGRTRVAEVLVAEGLRWRKQEGWFGERVDPEFAVKRGPSSASTHLLLPTA